MLAQKSVIRVELVLLAFAGLLISAFAHAARQDASGDQGHRVNVVQTPSGRLQGLHEDGVAKFLGIPYAAPPVDDLRWRPPRPPESWTGVRDATQFANTCPQTNTLLTFAAKSDTEDCLYLNVFAPEKPSHSKRPVMVWIHGGGLVDGESNDYDPGKLVRQGNVVVVTINYRLNALGFFALPSLDKEKHHQGNYGLMDQQQALRWVHDNIAAFGGDADNVTLFGESAGGLSVLANLASPTGKGLFQRAIVESPARGQKLRLKQPDLRTAEARGVALAKAAGCPDAKIDCLRSKSIETLQKTIDSYSTSLIVDGEVLSQPLGASFNQGEFNQVPTLIGANRDEGRFSVAYQELTGGKALTKKAYKKIVSSHDEYPTALVSKYYPLTRYDSPSVALGSIMTDARIVCPVGRLDAQMAQYVPVYAYEFADRTAPFYFPPVSFPYGAAHTAELQYLFAGYHGASGNQKELNDLQRGLSDQLVSYWTHFARTGDPNTPDTPDWPVFKADQQRFQLLQLPKAATIPADYYDRSHHCEPWAATS